MDLGWSVTFVKHDKGNHSRTSEPGPLKGLEAFPLVPLEAPSCYLRILTRLLVIPGGEATWTGEAH
jgi:hypothetical protein